MDTSGGGEWYSRTIRKLPVGARIFEYMPKTGYVGVGIVTGDPMPFPQAVLDIDGQQHRLAGLPWQAAMSTPTARSGSSRSDGSSTDPANRHS